jgi:alkylhydroperoxidase family enzyme
VAEANACDYCLAAHTTISTQLMRLPASTAVAARIGHGIDAKTDAALAFARELLASRGQVSATDVEALRAVGYSEGEVSEIIAYTCFNIFTNYFNLAVGTVVDFPWPSAGRGSLI